MSSHLELVRSGNNAKITDLVQKIQRDEKLIKKLERKVNDEIRLFYEKKPLTVSVSLRINIGKDALLKILIDYNSNVENAFSKIMKELPELLNRNYKGFEKIHVIKEIANREIMLINKDLNQYINEFDEFDEFDKSHEFDEYMINKFDDEKAIEMLGGKENFENWDVNQSIKRLFYYLEREVVLKKRGIKDHFLIKRFPAGTLSDEELKKLKDNLLRVREEMANTSLKVEPALGGGSRIRGNKKYKQKKRRKTKKKHKKTKKLNRKNVK